ncbi:hypothetical protein ElyMa_000476700 [Elysia marginata]|uniref:Uncharacterized protein n=1 Tax=Elysia marginata TaxID=1093978 RepID=A0AAV4FT77_9GAST|nr:hypothetical protein ElyMa_000476700 [Elysia marginata]
MTHRRRYWIHSIFRRRQKYGEYHHLLEEVLRDTQKCMEYLRMTPETFDLLLKNHDDDDDNDDVDDSDDYDEMNDGDDNDDGGAVANDDFIKV